MPNPPQYEIEKPIFQGAANAFIDCKIEGCDWSLFGKREVLRHAWNEHYRMNHSQEIGVVQINRNLREQLWLPNR